MARPEIYDDLSDNDRARTSVLTVVPHEAVNFPAVLQHISAALRAAESRPDILEVRDGVIYRRPTLEEQDAALRRAQSAWDRNEVYYSSARGGATEDVPSFARYQVNAWAKAENHEPITWTD